MKEIYSRYKLLGYKINELSNGYFIAQRPDGKQSLFSHEGNLIQGNFDTIRQLSDYVYGGFKESDAILFSPDGHILDMAPTEHNINMFNYAYSGMQCIPVYTSSNSSIFNICSSDGKAQFKNVLGYVYNVVYNSGKYKLVYSDEYYDYMNERCYIKTIDTEGNIEILDANSNNFITCNNHFIKKRERDKDIQIIDYTGNILYESSKIMIDNKDIYNDTVLILKDEYLEIKSKRQGIDIQYKARCDIEDALFTHNRDVLYIEDNYGNYLLNIKTMEVIGYGENIYYTHGNVVLAQNEQTTVYKLNLEPFEIKEIVTCDSVGTYNQQLRVTTNNEDTYYTLDLKPLIHEFD